MLAAGGTEMVADARQPFDDGLLVLKLRVEHAQRVRLDAPLAVSAELVLHLQQLLAQLRHVCRAAFLAADRVDVERRTLEAQPVEVRHQHLNTSASIAGLSDCPSTSAPI